LTYSILPLQVGTIRVQKSTLTFMRGFGEQLNVPILMWIVRDADHTYVVDTGAHKSVLGIDESARRWQAAHEAPQLALASAGVDANAVEMVIVTHLHYDHAGNCDLFPNAELVVQRRELEYARNPLPPHRRVYDSPALALPDDRWHLVDGSVEIRPGIRLLLTPGHTPGLQAVVVETAGGRTIIASDTIPLYENWGTTNDREQWIPSGSFIDLQEYYLTLDRIAAVGGQVLPGHDPAVLGEQWPR